MGNCSYLIVSRYIDKTLLSNSFQLLWLPIRRYLPQAHACSSPSNDESTEMILVAVQNRRKGVFFQASGKPILGRRLFLSWGVLPSDLSIPVTKSNISGFHLFSKIVFSGNNAGSGLWDWGGQSFCEMPFERGAGN